MLAKTSFPSRAAGRRSCALPRVSQLLSHRVRSNLGFSASRLMNSPPHWDELPFFFFFKQCCLFIFVFVGSLLLRGLFSSGGEPGLLSNCGT